MQRHGELEAELAVQEEEKARRIAQEVEQKNKKMTNDMKQQEKNKE